MFLSNVKYCSLLFFSLTHHFLFSFHITRFSVSVSHLLSFISPAPVLSYLLSVPLFFSTFTPSNFFHLLHADPPLSAEMLVHAQAAPTVWYKLPLHSSMGALWHRKEGWMAWELIKARGGHAPVCACAVCVMHGWHPVACGGRWVQWRLNERERLRWQLAASPFFSDIR